jgi:hypothetical protein
LYTHKIAKKYDEIWYQMLASRDLAQDQLARLEGVVADMEMAIPNRTVARQCNLKARLVEADRAPRKKRLSIFPVKSGERQGGPKSSGQGSGHGLAEGASDSDRASGLDRVDEIVSSTEVPGVASTVVDQDGRAGIRSRGSSADSMTGPFAASDLPNASIDLSKDRVKSRMGIEEMLMGDVWAQSKVQAESQGIESSLERLAFCNWIHPENLTPRCISPYTFDMKILRARHRLWIATQAKPR